MRRGGRRRGAAQAVLLLLAALAPLAQARPVAANPGDVTVFAGGGLGAGPALKVGQQPVGITADALGQRPGDFKAVAAGQAVILTQANTRR